MAHVIRDYGVGRGHVSVVLASNRQGRVEPFLFEERAAAERFAGEVLGRGAIVTALVYHGVALLDAMAAERLQFGARAGLRELEEGRGKFDG